MAYRQSYGAMSFYLRKSVRVGPLRFNLSKSGIGVSGGVRGARIGTGPRGNYVHLGRGGVYYRKTLPGGAGRRGSDMPREPGPAPAEDSPTNQAHLTEIESGEVSAMRDSSSEDLLSEIRQKKRAPRLAPWVAGAGVLAAAIALGAEAPPWVAAVVLAIGAGAALWAHRSDIMRKTVVLLYELESDAEAQYQALHDGFDGLMGCANVWHVEAEGAVSDWKRSAGANKAIRRQGVSLAKNLPPFFQSNIQVPAIPVGRQTLYFFPDRLLVFDSKSAGAVAYSELAVERTAVQFVEDGSVPRDAKVVDRTWQYVNKRGGPDRRFKDNREIPVTLYEDIHLRSPSGLNELIQVSKTDAGTAFEAALEALGASRDR